MYVHEPPCKRFQGSSYHTVSLNSILTLSKLRESGCPRTKAIKYLTRQICKTDSSVDKVGPQAHRVLQLDHGIYQIQGWEFGQVKYKEGSNKRVEEIMKRQKDELTQKLEKLDEIQKQKQQEQFTHQERFQTELSQNFRLPKDRNEKLLKIDQIKQLLKRQQKQRKHGSDSKYQDSQPSSSQYIYILSQVQKDEVQDFSIENTQSKRHILSDYIRRSQRLLQNQNFITQQSQSMHNNKLNLLRTQFSKSNRILKTTQESTDR